MKYFSLLLCLSFVQTSFSGAVFSSLKDVSEALTETMDEMCPNPFDPSEPYNSDSEESDYDSDSKEQTPPIQQYTYVPLTPQAKAIKTLSERIGKNVFNLKTTKGREELQKYMTEKGVQKVTSGRLLHPEKYRSAVDDLDDSADEKVPLTEKDAKDSDQEYERIKNTSLEKFLADNVETLDGALFTEFPEASEEAKEYYLKEEKRIFTKYYYLLKENKPLKQNMEEFNQFYKSFVKEQSQNIISRNKKNTHIYPDFYEIGSQLSNEEKYLEQKLIRVSKNPMRTLSYYLETEKKPVYSMCDPDHRYGPLSHPFDQCQTLFIPDVFSYKSDKEEPNLGLILFVGAKGDPVSIDDITKEHLEEAQTFTPFENLSETSFNAETFYNI